MSDERPYSSGAKTSTRTHTPVARPLTALTEAEHARIKQTVSDVKEFMPEIIPMMKELHAMGMIDGWRSVTVTKHTESKK